MPPKRRHYWLVVLLTLAVFSPVFTCDFTDLDDLSNVVRNPLLNPLNFQHLKQIWTHSYDAMYIPIPYTIWGILSLARNENNQLYPALFHALNLALHIINALLVMRLLAQLLTPPLPLRERDGVRGNPSRAKSPSNNRIDREEQSIFDTTWQTTAAIIFATLLFALHPVQVQAVAWISALRDLLATFFVLLAILNFLKLNEKPLAKNAGLTLLFLALALLSKPSAVIAPLLMLILHFFRDKRWSPLEIRTLVACFILIIPCLLWTKSLQPGGPQFGHPLPPAQRPLIALDTIGFYLTKISFPAHLGIEYSRTPSYVLQSHSPIWLIAAGFLLLTIATRSRKIFAITALFIAAILPVLGLVPFNYQFFSTVADHYLYLAMIAVALAGAITFKSLASARTSAIAGLIVLVLAVGSFTQTLTWQNSFTLWSHNITINPRSYISHFHLAQSYEQQRNFPAAEQQLRLALDISPHYSVARTELGLVLLNSGKIDQGLDELLASLKDAQLEDPTADLAPAYRRIGQLLLKRGRTQEAEQCFRAATQPVNIPADEK